ncbi:hypothetical protein NPIL_203151 [Nephila pilipes]|uniref:Uncharacterized protein n=1 Tax=Nephila pilipes TaxID=299642 RepID=A0A8X6QEV3_NEPPI|nr:hypothetical protein NPIL_203151 [Nephila pilipes]
MALILLSIVIELHFGVVCLTHQKKEDDTLTSPERTPFSVPPKTEREREKGNPKTKNSVRMSISESILPYYPYSVVWFDNRPFFDNHRKALAPRWAVHL